MKLPTIELPKFDGNYDAWLEFRDTFKSMIHDNDSFPDIKKFHYMRASLVGSASQVTKSVEFTADGYQVAWETICNRFNNTNLLVHNHVKVSFSLERLQIESGVKIRKMIITSKLDSQTLREWEEHSAESTEMPTLECLRSFLKNRTDFLQTLDSKGAEREQVKRREFRVSRGLLATNYSCPYCKHDHSIYT